MEKSFTNFYDLEAWKQSHKLAVEIYRITKQFPDDERFGITSQLRRAASSIGANIAEGFERYHFKDKSRFYYQARGSNAEVQNFLLLALDLGYINRSRCSDLGKQCNHIGKLINGLVRSLRASQQASTSHQLLATGP